MEHSGICLQLNMALVWRWSPTKAMVCCEQRPVFLTQSLHAFSDWGLLIPQREGAEGLTSQGLR